MEQFDLMGKSYEESLKIFPAIRDLEKNYALDAMQIQSGMQVLDYAAGTGYLSLTIAENIGSGHVTAVDISSVMLNQAQEKAQAKGLNDKITFIHTDDPKLPQLADNTFDRGVSLGGFHHFRDQIQICRNTYRALKPGGKMIFLDFEDCSPVQKHFDTLVHRHNPDGHLALFLSESRAYNLAHYAGCDNPDVRRTVFTWKFDNADQMGTFFRMHHGLKCSDETARDMALENFAPETAADGSVSIQVHYVALILQK